MCVGSVPEIVVPRGNDAEVAVTFHAVCMDGTVADLSLCAQNPPAIQSVVITAVSHTHQYTNDVVPKCTEGADKSVTCTITVAVRYWQLQVTAQSHPPLCVCARMRVRIGGEL